MGNVDHILGFVPSVVVSSVFDTLENLYASIFRIEVKGRRNIQHIQVEGSFPSTPLKGKRWRTAWYLSLGAVHTECDEAQF